MPPRASIVIRAFNEAQHIGRLLDGIQQQTQKDVEIILVDSGSTDDTVAIAQGFPIRLVTIRPEDFTFGKSLNLGIAQAKGEFVVMASAHVYPVDEYWLEKLLAPFENNAVALSYGAQRGADTTKFSEHQHFFEWFPKENNPLQEHPFCNNANAAIRRSLWQQHPYDETLTGLEDIAWGSWAVEQGHKLAYAAEAAIIHVHNERPRQVYNRYRREAIALKQILPKSKFSLRYFISHYLRYAIKDLLAAFRQRVLWRQFLSILQFRLLQYWGTYRGYQHAGPLTQELKQTFYYSPKALGPHKPSNPKSPVLNQ
ncbi:MAG: glycosyltransferase family 2 protein [Chloroflexi bacterium]|nr:MAG: glycosyltransferase family 2 protein [Chloroflexota bacterium]MBL1194305.1 glycosyltransferase family 2 protein [Chloroflexota bacterium]NOH11595.1 glycosyltransferase family 2 protein [Chloroflexota bacterium]